MTEILKIIKNVLIISLPGSPRRESISEHLNEIGLTKASTCHFINGVRIKNINDLLQHQIHAMEIPQDRTVCSPLLQELGDLGCLLAHLQACKFIVENKLAYTLVLEDDVEIYDIQALYNHEEDLCKNDFTFVHPEYLFGTQGQVISFNAAKHLWDARQYILTIGRPWDIVIWHKLVPIEYHRSLLPFVKHAVEYFDPKASERLQINVESTSSLGDVDFLVHCTPDWRKHIIPSLFKADNGGASGYILRPVHLLQIELGDPVDELTSTKWIFENLMFSPFSKLTFLGMYTDSFKRSCALSFGHKIHFGSDQSVMNQLVKTMCNMNHDYDVVYISQNNMSSSVELVNVLPCILMAWSLLKKNGFLVVLHYVEWKEAIDAVLACNRNTASIITLSTHAIVQKVM